MIRKIKQFEVHYNKNLDQRCQVLFGKEYRKDPHLRTITDHIIGSAFLPLHQDGLIEILFDKLTEIILAANVENPEDKIRRFRRYLAHYFKTSGPYALNNWNYYQMILDNDQVVCSSNGSEVKGYSRVTLLSSLLGFLGFFEISTLIIYIRIKFVFEWTNCCLF